MLIESTYSIAIVASNSSYTHKIAYTFGSLSGTILAKTASTGGSQTVSWQVPATFYAQVPSATSKTGTVTLTTYDGNTTVGTKSYTVTFQVSSNVKPTISGMTLTPVNTNAWAIANNIFLKNYTRVTATVSATAGSGSSITSYSFSGSFGSGTSTSNTWTSSQKTTTAGYNTVTVTVTDARGRTATRTDSTSVYAYTYAVPSISSLTVKRGDYSGGVWTQNDTSGTTVRVNCTITWSISGQGNRLTSVTSKLTNTTQGTSSTHDAETNDGYTLSNYTSGTFTYTSYFTNADLEADYTAKVTAVDSLSKTGTKTATLSTVSVPFNILPYYNSDVRYGPGVGFGRLATETNKILTAWEIKKSGEGTTYISGRDHAAISTTDVTSGSQSFWPIASAKTPTGSWDLGTRYDGTNENFMFSYATDANYNASTNTTNRYTITPDGDTNFYAHRRICAHRQSATTGTASNSYIPWDTEVMNTTNGAVSINSSGYITITYNGYAMLTAQVWFRNTSSTSARPWLRLQNRTSNTTLSSAIDDNSSGYVCLSIPNFVVSLNGTATVFGYYFTTSSNVTADISGGASGAYATYLTIELL